MHSGSIVKQATATARRVAKIAILSAVVIVAAFVAERVYLQHQISAVTEKLIAAHRSADVILLADERLTMSANMAAATGEERWINRYERNIPVIDKAIKEAVDLSPPAVANRFDAETRVANDRLVELERESFEKVHSGNAKAAREILDGPTYSRFKEILGEGTARFVNGTITSISAELTGIEQNAVVAIGLVLLISASGALLLWRALDTSLKKSETAMLDAERKIHSLAMSDLLTGLANRHSLRQALHIAINRAKRHKTKLAVLMIDLDRFKPINDRYGHLIGDLVLKAVADRMASALGQEGLRARFGGDEFVAAIEYPDDDEIPRATGRRLIEALSEPMTFDNLTVQIGASVGISTYPVDGTAEEELIRKADIALYRAKNDGRGSIRFYDATMHTDTDARAKLEDQLPRAIARGAIIPYFQPLVDLRNGELCGFEVLSRWQHPTRGIIAPADFIPIAESSGLIGALTIAVLKEACRNMRTLPGNLSLAINVSPQQIEDEWLAPSILAALKETGFPPQRLDVELTEHALVSDLAAAKHVISSLKSVGIKIALDDFGTGYSSLCYLSELPIDKIKIDRSFIRTLGERPESAKVVNAIIGLGRSLGVPTIAEGVETERDAIVLREIGCQLGQGFLFSKPVPPAELPKLVAELSTFNARAVA
jgi:diguanylate cyclase (GGDEF)-like protein